MGRPDRSRGFVFSGFIVTLFALLTSIAHARIEYDASSLLLKNSDQIGAMLKEKIRAAQKIQAKQGDSDDGEMTAEPEAIEHLKDAMRIVFARPDQDGARGNLFLRVRRELADLGGLDQVLEELAGEAINELRNQEGPRRTATYVVILENLMAEIRPEIKKNEKLKKIVERIRDSNIHMEKDAKLKNLLRSMSIPVSPSETAKKILDKDLGPSKK